MGYQNFDMVVKKLIMLYIFEKIEIPLTESSLIEICTHKNEWLGYMDCKEILWQLQEAKFIFSPNPDKRDSRYSITYDGISCLGHHYQKIPDSLRQEISKYTKDERMTTKRNQEYVADYYKHEDGSFVVTMFIKDNTLAGDIMTLTFKTRERQQAIAAVKKWRDFAPKAYGYVFDNLFIE